MQKSAKQRISLDALQETEAAFSYLIINQMVHKYLDSVET
jgi:hypothetical protein